MSDARWERVKEIFERVQGAPAHERAAVLEASCEGDAALKAEVSSLLEWDSTAEGFLDSSQLLPVDPSGDSDESAHEPVDALIGTTIGAYRVIDIIAKGGMGAVYRAVRSDQAFEKTVALKVIKRGMDTDQVVQRFEQERRALAALEHPNIARLIDGGSTADGRPYFVMEYVDGIPIDRYCEQETRTIEQRLDLFRAVCAGVAHAHRNLVVHRDLKPDNILVGTDGIPKLLDFGIAKLLQPDERDSRDTVTIAMTPGFASPEQRMNLPVTTAADVYSLGVTLHRLLTGQMPGGKLPSETATTPLLRRRLAGDLDKIVQKALREDPDRRYSSVEQFSEDIRRHLRGLPVEARPDTLAYRAGKFVRRNRTAVAMTAVASMAAVAGVIGIQWQAQAAQRERNEARVQAERAQRVSALLSELLQSPDPLRRGRDVRVVDVLDEASRRIDRELTDDPQVRASLLAAIGKAFMSIGVLDRAEDHVRRALDLRLKIADTPPAEMATTYADLGAVIRTKGDLKAAEQPMRQALDLYRRAYGAEHAEIASVMNELGGLLQERGELDDAESMQRASLAMRQKLFGPRHRDVADSLNDLGVVLGTRGDFKAAEPLHREALDIARAVQGPRHPDIASTMMTLAFVREMNGDMAGAEQLYRDALDIRREALGNSHPDTAWTMYSYAAFMRAKNDHQNAIPLLREVLALRGKTLPDGHRIVGSALYELGRSFQLAGDHAAAESTLRDCLRVRGTSLGADHWLVRSAESSLGESLGALGRTREAEGMLVMAYEALQKLRGPSHPATRDALERLNRFKAGRKSI